jgi:formylglycine-generating enzyme required for sulfatase activity
VELRFEKVVTILSEPLEAQIELDGKIIGTAPIKTIPLVMGSNHRVKARFTGFSGETNFTVDTSTDSIVARPTTGRVEIASSLPMIELSSPGVIFQDSGSYRHIATDVPPGSYSIEIKKSGYQTNSMTLEVTAGTTVFVSASLKRDERPLKIESVPPGATIRVDGLEVGKAPLITNPYEIGSQHKVAADFGGEMSAISEAVVDYSENIVLLEPGNGMLTMKVTPPDASVVAVLARDKVTKLPITNLGNGTFKATNIPPASYLSQIEKTGFVSKQIQIDIKKGSVFSEELNLERISALFEMIPIQGGTFMMGSNSGDSDEKPVHQVSVSSFELGKYEVTQEQYQKVMGNNPSSFQNGNDAPKRPVEQVSWYDAVNFCNRLSEMQGLQKVYTINGFVVSADFSKGGYRLPTEAEWEYAARGGSQTRGYTYSGSNDVNQVGWSYDNSGNITHAVGTKAPNELGLYDMSGNIWEWCWDLYGKYSAKNQTDPVGTASGDARVIRGGGWGINASGLRSANRDDDSPDNRYINLGFRILRPMHSTVFVQGGTFMMGSNSGSSVEKPVHQVTVSSFMMGKYEVTQEQYKQVMGNNPSKFTSGSDASRRPVEQVSWYEAVAFCNKLSEMEGLQQVYTINGTDVRADFSRNGYRLPTEAEWEYAARGGSLSRSYTYSGSNNAGQVAWYEDNSGNTTHAVGTMAPNELGLYDMSGNVWEWCWDWHRNSYNSGQETDPMGAASGYYRVSRGGNWDSGASSLRSASRGGVSPDYRYSDLGFRLLRRP